MTTLMRWYAKIRSRREAICDRSFSISASNWKGEGSGLEEPVLLSRDGAWTVVPGLPEPFWPEGVPTP